MDDLIEGLTILAKYLTPEQRKRRTPTHCSHDTLTIMDVPTEGVSEEDVRRLDELGFFVGDPWDTGDKYWMSFRYGSA